MGSSILTMITATPDNETFTMTDSEVLWSYACWATGRNFKKENKNNNNTTLQIHNFGVLLTS